MADKPKLVLASDAPSQTPADALDIESLFLDPALGDMLTNATQHIIPVGKPKDFFRVHPEPSYRRPTEIYVHKTEGQFEAAYYILGPRMRKRLEEARPCVLVTYIFRDGSFGLWPIVFPREGEKDNAAWVSARAAARVGMEKWVRLVWHGRAYLTRDAAPGYAPNPDWSKAPAYDDLVRAGLGQHGVIHDEGHPMWRELMGGGPAVANVNDGI